MDEIPKFKTLDTRLTVNGTTGYLDTNWSNMDNAEKWERFVYNLDGCPVDVGIKTLEAYQQSLKELIEKEREGTYWLGESKEKALDMLLTLIDKCEPTKQ